MSECAAEGNYGVSEEEIIALVTRDTESRLREKFGRCLYQKAGILEPDGNLNPDSALAILNLLGIEKNAAEELLQKCSSLTGYDERDMAYAIFKCFDRGVNHNKYL